MKRQFSALVGVDVVSAFALLAFPPVSRGQTPPRRRVHVRHRDPPATEVIGGALKPAGTGPFPAVISMSGCGGIDSPPNRAQQTATIDHLRSKGAAVLIVDSFTPRNEPKGVCANLGNLDGEIAIQYASRGSNDALAALKVLKAMPDIDTKHIFLMGFSLGASSSLLATDTKNPANRNAKVAGVVAYYPFC